MEAMNLLKTKVDEFWIDKSGSREFGQASRLQYHSTSYLLSYTITIFLFNHSRFKAKLNPINFIAASERISIRLISHSNITIKPKITTRSIINIHLIHDMLVKVTCSFDKRLSNHITH